MNAKIVSPERLITLGRVMVSSLFILGGVNKILNFDETLITMAEAGLSPTFALLVSTIILELGGGLMIALRLRFHIAAAFALACFTLVVNVVFHNFWVLEEPQRTYEVSLFFKNIVVAGALIVIAGIGMDRAHKAS